MLGGESHEKEYGVIEVQTLGPFQGLVGISRIHKVVLRPSKGKNIDSYMQAGVMQACLRIVLLKPKAPDP